MSPFSCGSLVVALTISACYAQEPTPLEPRLPNFFVPLSYVLRLEPNVTSKSVTGAVIITFNATFPQNETVGTISLHLGTDSIVNESAVVVLDLTSGLKKNTSAVEYDDDNTLFRVLFAEDSGLVGNHIYLISLQFESKLYLQPQGLFYGSVNETSWYVAANLRPTFARYVFPCFDEPRFRVPVTLQVLHPIDYAAYSITPLDTSEITSDNRTLDTFRPTGAIPLHGLSLLITQLIPTVDSQLRLFAPANTTLPSSFPFLTEFLGRVTDTFGLAPVTPVNLVVLPDRFRDTFSSIGFIYTTPMEYYSLAWPLGPGPRLAFPEEFIRQYLEFPHSPAWWSHIWLSESIGRFLALNFHPEQWVRNWLKIEARSVGADFSSGPVFNPMIQTQWDIQKALSSQVIKMKGLSILLMWNDTLPVGVVKKTIVNFIKNSGSTVTTDEFLTLLGQNIEAESLGYNASSLIPLLPAWLYSPSIPIVSFWPQSINNSLVVSQAPYPLDNKTSAFGLSISYTQNISCDWHNFRQGLWLASNVTNLTTPLTAANWTLLNLEAAPYRVEYKDDSWHRLVSALSLDLASDIPESLTAAIQDDVVSMALEGRGYFTDLFLVLNSTKRSTFDWIPVMKAFKGITNLIGPNTYVGSIFKSFAASLFPAELLTLLDLRNESLRPDQLFVRALTAPWLCALDIGTCRVAAGELMQELLIRNWTRIHWSLAEVVVCSGVRDNSSNFQPLLVNFQITADPSLRSLLAMGLGCVTDPPIVSQMLTLIGNSSAPQLSKSGERKVPRFGQWETPISSEELETFLMSLANQQENVPAIVTFLVNSSYSLQDVIGPQILSSVIDVLGQFRSTDVLKLSALQNDTGLHSQVIQSVGQLISRANININWWTNNSASFEADLAENQNVTITTAASTEGSTTASPTTASSGPTTGGSTGGSTSPTSPPGSTTPKPSSAHDLGIGVFQTLAILIVSLITHSIL